MTHKLARFTCFGLFLFSFFTAASAAEKLRPEEVVARHLDALGSADARSRYETCVVNGMVTMGGVVGGGTGELSGKLTILSDGVKTRIGMQFPSESFPGDHYAYDGERVTVSNIQPGVRSLVGSFFYQFPHLLSEGLLAGELTTNWALLHVERRKPRLSYRGLKKTGDKQLHALGYRPRKGDESVEITIFFDPETYRHVKTEYRFEPPAESRQETRVVLSEEFEEFKTVEGLSLPSLYRIEANITGARSLVYRWRLTLDEFFLNKPLDPGYFIVK